LVIIKKNLRGGPLKWFGVSAAAAALLLGVASPVVAADHWSTYRNSSTSAGSLIYGVVGNVSGGSVQASIGNQGHSTIRTYNVFGDIVHAQVATNDTTTTMTHTIRYDGRSACFWTVRSGAPNPGPKNLQCQQRHTY
jgi:hypothetical protein